jgi:hypothetical protein
MRAHPPTVILVIITYKVAVYAPGERADTLPLLLLYPYLYSVVCLLHVFATKCPVLYSGPRGKGDGFPNSATILASGCNCAV